MHFVAKRHVSCFPVGVASEQDSPRWSFLGRSAHVEKSSWLKSRYSEKTSSLKIQGFTNFTAALFVAKCQASWNEIVLFQSLPKIHVGSEDRNRNLMKTDSDVVFGKSRFVAHDR